MEKPGSECPPPRTATRRFSLRAKSTARMTSETPAQRTLSAGRRLGAPFQIARLVMAVVRGAHELPAQALLELAERCLAEHVGDGRCAVHVRLGSVACPVSSNALNPAVGDLSTP